MSSARIRTWRIVFYSLFVAIIAAEWFGLRHVDEVLGNRVLTGAVFVLAALLLADGLIQFKRTEVDRVIFVEGSAISMQVISVSAFVYLSLQPLVRLPPLSPWWIVIFIAFVQGACQRVVQRRVQ